MKNKEQGKEQLRKTGIELIGNTPWGTHFCQFYQTKEDLISILVPYFKAGLENNEFCMWVTSEPLNVEDAAKALKKEVKDLDDYIKKGRIEILDYSQWYTKSGHFDSDEVLQGWVEKESQARKRGFDGLRLTGNTFWLEKSDWREFTDYEATINRVIGKYRMLAICTYSLDKCGGSEIADVVVNHQFALIKRGGKWEIIENSEHQRTVEALELSEERYAVAQRAANIGSWDWDIRTNALHWSDRIEPIFGFGSGEFGATYEAFLQCVHPEDRQHVIDSVNACVEEAKDYVIEHRIVWPDGTVRWVSETGDVIRDENGKAIRMLGVVQDITERKRAEEALRESEEKFRSLVETTSDWVWEVDLNGIYTYVSPKIKDLLGYEPEEVVGKTPFDLMPTDEADRVAGLFRNIVESRKAFMGLENTNLHKNGRKVVLETSGVPIFNADGTLCGYRGIDRDITERKNMEAEVSKRTHDLGERIKELNCLYGISHIVEEPGISLEEIYQGVVEIIPLSWQYPEITCARIILEDQIYKSNNFEESDWKQSSDILVRGERIGRIAVFYLEERPEIDEGPFSKEERNLLDEIAERLGKITERKRAEEKIKKSEQKFRTIFESIPGGILIVDQDRRVQAINKLLEQTFGISRAEVINKRAGEVLQCIHASEIPEGCGYADYCRNCQVWLTVQKAFAGKQIHRNKAKVEILVDGKVQERSLLVSAALIEYEDKRLVIIIFEDITELNQLRHRLKTEQSFAGIISRDFKMLELFATIKELAEINAPVLIQGESGSGKELVASAIHNEGPRADKQFIPVNCGALPDGLLESELFGHVRGAFTGAIRDKKGRFELADGGTIFLDEVGDLSPAMQVKLLRVLQTGCFERVGGEKTIKVNVRVISATNKSLEKEIAAGRFREDLYYRLCVVPITMPPLRERVTDIPLLAEYFLERAANESGHERVSLSSEALAMLMDYKWPGNVRELQNALQFALVKCHGQVIELQYLPLTVRQSDKIVPSWKRRRRKLESKAVADALRQTKGNRLKAARLLGVSRATLHRFLAEEKNQTQDS